MSNLQKIINYLYRHPKSKYKTIKRFGGYWRYRQMLKGQMEMQDASISLPPIISQQDGLPIYFLTGKKYLYQTLFCAHSLTKVTKEKIQFNLVDDGSFDEKFIQQVNLQMPGVKIITKADIEINLQNRLPKMEYPYLHHKRVVYPHIKKLTDIHTIDGNPHKLVLDSDMLFWNEPIEIINWLKQPRGCLYMLDCEESYGYDRSLMQALCGFQIPELMNVGAFGLNSSIINWDNLEQWSKKLEEEQGASYFLEQALSAMLIANEENTILNNEEYIVNPSGDINNLAEDKLHHYVDLSKQFYFETAWKKFII
ncbi:MAG TPA: hypothetical protein VL088_15440 [Pedobacter sp.]|nr:hypothetical protein [Pedobacter sp.]